MAPSTPSTPPQKKGPPNPKTLELVLKELESLHQTQLTELTGLSTRAGLVLSAAITLVASLAVASRTTLATHTWFIVPGELILVAAAAVALFAYRDETVDVGPDEGDLAGAIRESDTDVMWGLVEMYRSACETNGTVAIRRGRFLQAALAVLLVGIVAVAAGILLI